MNYPTRRQPLACIGLGLAGWALLTAGSCDRPAIRLSSLTTEGIRPSPPTVEELAEEVGVTFCNAEAHYLLPHYARLVTTITDAQGQHRRELAAAAAERMFRVQIVLRRNPSSGYRQSLTYALNSAAGGQKHYLPIDPQARDLRTEQNSSGQFFYELLVEGKAGKIRTRIELETSLTPFPKTTPPEPVKEAESKELEGL